MANSGMGGKKIGPGKKCNGGSGAAKTAKIGSGNKKGPATVGKPKAK